MVQRTMKTLAVVIPAGAVALLAACPSREVSEVEPRQAIEQEKKIDVEVTRKIDILFVIDDSKSMEEEQRSLADEFPRFMDVLGSVEGGLPDVHIGVVSTDMGGPAGYCGEGRDGRLTLNECPGIEDPYLVDVSTDGDVRDRNYDGNLEDHFACMAQLGVQGCGFEQPLEAMRRALEQTAPAGANEGFIRDDAYLAVVLITDEDDCSAADPALFSGDTTDPVDSELGPLSSFRCFDYGVDCDPDDRSEGERRNCEPQSGSPYLHDVREFSEFLVDFKGSAGDVVVAAIRGDPAPVSVEYRNLDPDRDDDLEPTLAPSCATENGEAAPAIRIETFLDQFPQANHSESICRDSLQRPLEEIAGLIASNFGPPCVEGNLRDADPDRAGIQPECEVSEVVSAGTASEVETLLPECDADRSTTPCWTTEIQTRCQPPSEFATETGLALVIDRGGDKPPLDSTIEARCAAE